MKVVAIFVLATCIAASKSASDVKNVDWSAVSEKVKEFQALVTDLVQRVKTISSNDNPGVGESIEAKFDGPMGKANNVLNRANKAIAEESMTVTQAEGLLAELNDILAGVEQDLQEEIAQLSARAASQVRNVFSTYFESEKGLESELYALLYQ